MKKYLLPPKNSYKANMHCHTNLSDGKLSPEEVKEAYKAKGYSVVAYTDHDALIPHPELRDKDFLPLNGFEAEFLEDNGMFYGMRKACHMCIIALDENNITMPFYNHTVHFDKNTDKVKIDESLPQFIYNYSPECVNEAIRIARERGFFVTYNHPVWSMERYNEYSKYIGMNALEVYNGSCIADGYDEKNSHVYDEMMLMGKNVGAIGGDDNHNVRPFDNPKSGSFAAFTVIKADKLEYKDIADALLNGDYYASTGPEISEIYYEDGNIVVKCPSAEKITMSTGYRAAGAVYREKGKRLTEARFPVKNRNNFVRFCVYDKYGNCAFSRAYTHKEIFDGIEE